MRAERPQDRWFARAAGITSAALGPALGALVAGGPGALAGLTLGAVAALALGHRLRRRGRLRSRALAAPFPERWRLLLLDRYDHYERLPPPWRVRFEADVRLFLAEARITGVGIEVDEVRRLLIAASAVTLSLGWPEAEWDALSEVLLYPDDFDRDYRFGGDEDGRAGETHAWGTVILSAPALDESFDYDDDAYHVGLHEFAHLLELAQAEFDGIPVGLRGDTLRAWPALVEQEMERLRRGRSVLDGYGADDVVEFFPVAVEAFFERPRAMRARHAELYEALRGYFRQDPAAWDDARSAR